MIFLLIVVAWIVTMSVVAGLCVAARLGDAEQPTRAAAAVGGAAAESSGWDAPEPAAMFEPAEVFAGAQAPDGARLRRGGIAA